MRWPLWHRFTILAVLKALLLHRRLPNVAVFDTAFHSTLAPEAYTYPIPSQWTKQWKLRRFGFHGLSNAYAADKAAQILDRPLAELRLIVALLGNGASLAAIRDGKSIDTTMGFTPLEGLMMGTRSGSVDPGLLLHLLREQEISAVDLDRTLNEESGLLGVSGVSSDMRSVMLAAEAGDERAELAIAMYVHRLRQAIGAMAATLGGVDALVFTGGVGEHSATIRAATCKGLVFIGLELDPIANAAGRADVVVSAAESNGIIIVVSSNEELILARMALRTVDPL